MHVLIRNTAYVQIVLCSNKNHSVLKTNVIIISKTRGNIHSTRKIVHCIKNGLRKTNSAYINIQTFQQLENLHTWILLGLA